MEMSYSEHPVGDDGLCEHCGGEPGGDWCRGVQEEEAKGHPAEGCCYGLGECECMAIGQTGCCAMCAQGEFLDRCEAVGGVGAYFEAMIWQHAAAEGSEWN